jgi:hypothetical protein
MRCSNTSPDQSAKSTEQDRRTNLRMRIFVRFRPDGSSDSKPDEGSDQSMSSVPSLSPHSCVAGAGISHVRRDKRSTLGKL